MARWERSLERRADGNVLVSRDLVTGRVVRHRVGGLELRSTSGRTGEEIRSDEAEPVDPVRQLAEDRAARLLGVRR
jgi:hypothetical protein